MFTRQPSTPSSFKTHVCHPVVRPALYNTTNGSQQGLQTRLENPPNEVIRLNNVQVSVLHVHNFSVMSEPLIESLVKDFNKIKNRPDRTESPF